MFQENQYVEFKSLWRDEYLKYLSGFANSDGGKLIIGITDDRKPIEVKYIHKLLDEIPNKSKNLLGIIPSVKLEKNGNIDVLAIEVGKSYAPISYEGNFYIRSGSSLFQLKGKDLNEFLISHSGKTWEDYTEENATISDLDVSTINEFKSLAVERFPLAEQEKNNFKLLEKLNLVENKKLKRAALLLFGKNPKKFFPGAFIKIGKFVSDTDIISSDDIEGNLFQQVNKAMEVLKNKYLVSNIKFDGIYRKEELEYPIDALREIILNAVIHKDYLGVHTQIKIYLDKFSVWNEGGLPKEISISDLSKDHASRPRNNRIADVFFKAGLVETWGRGTIKIINECLKAQFPQPTFSEKQNGFSVTILKDIYTEEYIRKLGLNERQIKSFSFLKQNGKITNSDYQKINNTSKPTATRDLKEMVLHNILYQKGTKGSSIYYVLKLVGS